MTRRRPKYRTFGDAAILQRCLETWNSRSAQADHDGRAWYPGANRICREVSHTTSREVARVVYACAALSPRVSWSQNVAMLRSLCARSRFANPGTFPAFARDAWAVLKHGDLARCSGPKREPFARAIGGDHSAVVVDRWLLRIVGHPPYNPSNIQVARYAALIARFAADIGEHSARDVQAVLWCAIRNDVSSMTTIPEEVPF